MFPLRRETTPPPHPHMQRPLSFASVACDPTAILTKPQQHRYCSNALARTVVEFSSSTASQHSTISPWGSSLNKVGLAPQLTRLWPKGMTERYVVYLPLIYLQSSFFSEFSFPPCKAKSIGDGLMNRQNEDYCFMLIFFSYNAQCLLTHCVIRRCAMNWKNLRNICKL